MGAMSATDMRSKPNIHISAHKMSSSHKIVELSHSALFREYLLQQLTGDQTLESLQLAFAQALGMTVERFTLVLKDAEATEAHEVRTGILCQEAVDPATNWTTIPNPRRVELILSVKQTYPPPDPWANSKEFCLFSERVRSIIGIPLFYRLVKSATKLSHLHPLGYKSSLWYLYVNEVDEEERIHDVYRVRAAAEQDSLVAGTDSEAFSWAYKEAHCEECLALGFAKLPEERRSEILMQLKEQRDCDYDDYMEHQEAMQRSYHGGW
jgi:hypothetical protein